MKRLEFNMTIRNVCNSLPILILLLLLCVSEKADASLAYETDVQIADTYENDKKDAKPRVEDVIEIKQADANETSVGSASKSAGETSSAAQYRKAPEVVLKSEEWVYPKEWSEQVLRRLDYDRLVPDFPVKEYADVFEIKQLMVEKKYDAVFKSCVEELCESFSNGLTRKDFSSETPLDIEPSLFRIKTYCMAAAMELNGDLYSAGVAYHMLYPQTGLDKPHILSPNEWQRLRLNFEGYFYPIEDDWSSLSDAEFFRYGFNALDLCKLIIATCPYDDIDPILERFDSGEGWRRNISVIPVSRDDPLYDSAFKLYLIRDNLARFMYPGLHFFQYKPETYKKTARNGNIGMNNESARNKELTLLTRKSYSQFVAFFEKYLVEIERRKERGLAKGVRTPISSEESQEIVDKTTEILKQIEKLPY